MIPDASDRIEDIKKFGKNARGRRELIWHYQGKELTRKQAMEAWCYDCLGYYSDGVSDCETPSCPIYQYHPYKRSKSPKKARSQKQIDAGIKGALRLSKKRANGTVKLNSVGENR